MRNENIQRIMYAVEITCLTLIAVLALLAAADFAVLAIKVSASVQPPY